MFGGGGGGGGCESVCHPASSADFLQNLQECLGDSFHILKL